MFASGCYDVEPELEVVEHGYKLPELGVVPGHLDATVSDRLLQRRLAEDDSVQAVAREGDRGIGIVRLLARRVVEHPVLELEQVFSVLLAEIEIERQFGVAGLLAV